MWMSVEIVFLLYLNSQYSTLNPENVLSGGIKTERACVAYATYHAKTATSDFRYRIKDVECQTEAPFICQYNPGRKKNER